MPKYTLWESALKLNVEFETSLIDSKGNKIVMDSDEFHKHQLLRESDIEKEVLTGDIDRYLSHGYHKWDDVKKI